MLDKDLFGSEVLREGGHEERCGEVEDEAKGDGNGEGWKGFFEDGQHDECQAQTLSKKIFANNIVKANIIIVNNNC